VIGYRDGRIFEVFVRNFVTLTDATGGPTGFSTAEGMAGARYKPFPEVNLILETAGLFALGVYGRNDWMLRSYASQGQGTDLRVEEPSWWMWNVYGDYAHFVVTPQNLMAFEARAGRSFRLDRVSDHLVATPYGVIGAAYDDTLATPGALGIGPGFSLRYWFRDDTYAAPRSFVRHERPVPRSTCRRRPSRRRLCRIDHWLLIVRAGARSDDGACWQQRARRWSAHCPPAGRRPAPRSAPASRASTASSGSPTTPPSIRAANGTGWAPASCWFNGPWSTGCRSC
jgi:hypothetical protein